MTLVENEQFAEWLDGKIDGAVLEKHSTPARKTRKVIPGVIAKVWRRYHNRMLSTAQYFNTATHKEEADRVEFRGWSIVEVPARQYVTKSHLFFEIAQGLNKEIPQLSHKTQISQNGDYPHRIMGHHMPRSQEIWNIGDEMSPEVSMIDYKTYEIEWKEFMFSIRSSMFFNEMARHYLAVAYDAMNDCLYVDYRN